MRLIFTQDKARKLIRVRAEVKGDEFPSVRIMGYFAIPRWSIVLLGEMLVGVKLDAQAITDTGSSHSLGSESRL